jgi:hypothetical protein
MGKYGEADGREAVAVDLWLRDVGGWTFGLMAGRWRT